MKPLRILVALWASAVFGELGAVAQDQVLNDVGEQADGLEETGERLGESTGFQRREKNRLSGRLTALDHSGHASTLVQALQAGKVYGSTFSNAQGYYQITDLSPGEYQVRTPGPNGFLYYRSRPAMPTDEGDLLAVGNGTIHNGLDIQFAPFNRGHWTQFQDFEAGVTLGRIRSIHSAPDGALWLASDSSGIVRYDGTSFSKTTQAEGARFDNIRQMYLQPDGAAWIGTVSGSLIRYDGIGRAEPVPSSDRRFGHITEIFRDSTGRLWVGRGERSDGGGDNVALVSQSSLAFEPVPALRDLRDMHEDSVHGLWAATWGHGVFREVEGQWTRFEPPNGRLSDRVHCIASDANGNLWFGSAEGLFRYDGAAVHHYGQENGMAALDVRVIYPSDGGVIWLGTAIGLTRFDGVHFVNFNRIGNIGRPEITALHQDPSGMLWCGTDSGGLFRFDPDSMTKFNRSHGMPDVSVTDLLRDRNGSLWIGSQTQGAFRFNSGQFVTVDPDLGPTDLHIAQLVNSPTGNLWFVGDDGAKGIDLDGRPVDTGFDQWGDSAILPLPNGVTWIATERTIQIFERAITSEPASKVSDVEFDGVEAMTLDSHGNIWLARKGYGIYWVSDGKFHQITTETGLVHDRVESIEEASNGSLWITTRGGISRFEYLEASEENLTELPIGFGILREIEMGEPERLRGRWTNFTTKNGLAHNWVITSFEDREGTLWFGTKGRGVMRHDGQSWTSLDTADGLPSNDVTSIAQDDDGVLWFGTTGGLCAYRSRAVSPVVHFALFVADRLYTNPVSIEPIPIDTRVSIRLDTVDLRTDPTKQRIRYRLYSTNGPTGSASAWEYGSAETVIQSNIREPGDYTIEVQAIDRDLNYSKTERLQFSVFLPWHQDPRFRAPAAGAVGLLVTLSLFFGVKVQVHRRKAHLLQEQMVRQERTARRFLEEKNRSIEQAKAELEINNQRLAIAKKQADSANRAKSTFLANMSHEIRTPLNAVLGYAQLIERDEKLLPDQRSSVTAIERSGDHLLNLINEILDLSKIEAGRMELNEHDFDLWALIEDVRTIFKTRCEAKGIDWKVCNRGNGPSGFDRMKSGGFVRGDAGKLRQILINLLGNALKFTDSGRITLTVVGPDQYGVSGSGGDLKSPDQSENRTWYSFEISDTGRGIPEEARERIFEPFVQEEEEARAGGTGLGLAITKRQTELMGGKLRLESRLGLGTTVQFELPLDLPESNEIEAPHRREGRRLRLKAGVKVKALIVDDIEENRDLLAQMLESIGVEFCVATDGFEAIESLRNACYDIVFLDIRMPGMDGFEVFKKISDEFGEARPKIVVVSASVLSHRAESCVSQGLDAFIGKPFRFEEIIDVLVKELSVEFESVQLDQEVKNLDKEVDLNNINIPAELLNRMRRASSLSRVSELEGCLYELERLDEKAQRLSTYLRKLLHEVRLKELKNLIQSI